MLHKAWNSKGEVPYCFPKSSIKFQGHTGQNITAFDPNWAFPDYRPVAAFKSLRFALLIKHSLAKCENEPVEFNVEGKFMHYDINTVMVLQLRHNRNSHKYFFCKAMNKCLTHWGWVMHICISKLTIIGSDNGLSPGRRQAIIWTNAGVMFTGPLGANFSEILIEIFYIFIQENAFGNVVWKMTAILSRPQCVKKESAVRSVS